MTQLVLDLEQPDTLVVHCCFCPDTVVEHTDPSAAHETMEDHYRSKHGALLALITRGL